MNHRLEVPFAGKVWQLDLTEETPAITKAAFSPDELTQSNYGYTYRFTLPYTAANSIFFGYFNEPQVFERITKFLGVAYYYFNDVLVFLGNLYFEESNEDGFEVSIRNVGDDWIKIAQKRCNEIENSTMICCNDSSGFYDNPPSHKYIVPLCDFGEILGVGIFVQAGYLRLWAKVKELLDDAFALDNYRIESDFLNANPMVIYGGKNVLTSQNQAIRFGNDSFTRFYEAEGTNLDPLPLPNSYTFDFDTATIIYNPCNISTIANSIPLYPELICDIDISYELEYSITVSVTAGNPTVVINTVTIGTIGVGTTTLSGSFTSNSVIILPTILSLNPFTVSYWKMEFSIKTRNHYNFYIIPHENYPDYTIGELLKRMQAMFNLFIHTDAQRRVIYIEPYEPFFSKSESIDWTHKIITDLNRGSVQFQDVPKIISFEYKESKNYLSNAWRNRQEADYGIGVIQKPQPTGINWGNMSVATGGEADAKTISVGFCSFFNYSLQGFYFIPFFGSNPGYNYTGEDYIAVRYTASFPGGIYYSTPNNNLFFVDIYEYIWFDYQGFKSVGNGYLPYPQFTTRFLGFGGDYGLFKTYWESYLSAVNNKVFIYKAHLGISDINGLDFRYLIRIENQLYRLIELEGWSPDTLLATVKLIKVNNNKKGK